MSLLSALPGVDLRVSEVNPTLSRMWQVEPEARGSERVLFRASQMNLILHFGMQTTEDEARGLFQVAIRFGQRYPCRMIVLCPVAEQEGEDLLEAKLFTQCYIGASMREMCCCEALMLSYPTHEFVHLRNQVSVWMESDLPTYHWFHRVPAQRIEDQYLGFIEPFRRILFDRSVEGEGYDAVPWPRPERLRDIAEARLLSVKQSLGPMLSAYRAQTLTEGLERVAFWFHPKWTGEGEHLRRWVLACLEDCWRSGPDAGEMEVTVTAESAVDGPDMSMEWFYRDREKFFAWEWREAESHALIRLNFGEGSVEYPHLIKRMEAEEALAEALFF